MWFWIFMLAMNVWLPLTMIGFGRSFSKRAPGKINYLFGYRTTRSMKNEDTWTFAHQYFGKLWQAAGWIMLVVSPAAMLFLLGKGDGIVGNIGGLLCLLQVVVLIIPIFPTERALKRTFDEDGHRRQADGCA